MSIAYFPDKYPGELVYSVLSRGFGHGSYTSYRYAAEDFFVNPKIRVEKEFMKNLKPEVIELLTKDMGLKELVEKHTMYPMYGRFISKERREKAFQALLKMEGDFSKLFGVPNNKGESRYLRYCPICAVEDREQMGETYWRRHHQIRGLHVCYKHGCYLYDSTVSLDSRDAVNLVSAEETIPEELEIKKCDNPLEIRLAEYMVNVFEMPIDQNNELSVAKFFHTKLVGTPYISSRGEHKYYTKLWEDMRSFYNNVPLMEEVVPGHIQRLLMGTRVGFEEICMVAMFLEIPEDELVKMDVHVAAPQKEFDQKVMKLIDSGMSMRETAKQLGVSSSIVRMVTEINKKEQMESQKIRRSYTKVDWTQIDTDTLPAVRVAIAELHGGNGDRPKRVSVYSVAKKINIPVCRLQKMKLCMQKISYNRESAEKYHARKVKWALGVIAEQEKLIKLWRICSVSKLKQEEVRDCLLELKKMVDFEMIMFLEKELETILES